MSHDLDKLAATVQKNFELFEKHLSEFQNVLVLLQELNGRVSRARIEFDFLKHTLLQAVDPDGSRGIRDGYTEKFEKLLEDGMLDLERTAGPAQAASLDQFLRPQSGGQNQPPPPESPPDRRGGG